MKRFSAFALSILIALSVIVFTIPAAADGSDVWDGSVASGFASGSGVESDPYIISTPAQWAYFASQVTAGTTYSGKFIKLTANLTFNTGDAADWASDAPANEVPTVGTDGKPFKGTFDGDGYTISGIYVDGGSDDGTGIFGEANGATIRNLVVRNTFIVCEDWCGILVGEASGSITIENVYLDADTSLQVTREYKEKANAIAGGFLGGIYSSSSTVTIRNSVFAGTVNLTGSPYGSGIGGFVGSGNTNDKDNVLKIHKIVLENCLMIGTISGTNSSFMSGFMGGNGSVKTDWDDEDNDLNTFTGCVYASEHGYNTSNANSYPFTNSGKSGAAVTDCYSTVSGNVYKANNTNQNTSDDIGVTKIIPFQLWGSEAEVTINGWTKRADDIMIPSGVAAFAPASGLPTPQANLSERLPTAEAATAFAGGDGTADSPYQISNIAELQFFANTVSAGETYEGKYVILTADIVLDEDGNGTWDEAMPQKQFLSIGQSAQDFFAGDFNGNSKTISGLCIVKAGEKEGGTALFAGIQSGANIHDFLLKNSYILSENDVTASAIVAYVDLTDAEKTVTVANIYAQNVKVNGGSDCGGIVGQILTTEETIGAKTEIKSCVFAGIVAGNGQNIGGILGNANGATKATVSDCLNLGSISGSTYVAGIVARADAGILISHCINAGEVKATENNGYAADLFVAGKGTLTTGLTLLEGCYHIAAGKKAFYNSSQKDEPDSYLDYTVRMVKPYVLWADCELALKNWTRRTEGDGDIVIPTGVAAFAPASGLAVPERPEPETPPKPSDPEESTTAKPTPNTTTAPSAETPGTTASAGNVKKKGCGSAIGSGIAVMALIALAGVAVCRKKED